MECALGCECDCHDLRKRIQDLEDRVEEYKREVERRDEHLAGADHRIKELERERDEMKQECAEASKHLKAGMALMREGEAKRLAARAQAFEEAAKVAEGWHKALKEDLMLSREMFSAGIAAAIRAKAKEGA